MYRNPPPSFQATRPVDTPGSAIGSAPGTKPRGQVFVVDDDDAVRDSLRWLLEANGFIVKVFVDAEHFLEALPREKLPACVVLDVRMPKMSGVELHEKLHHIQALLPVVFVTGHGDVPMAVESMKRGAVDFLEKPFNDAQLCELIDRALLKVQEDSSEQAKMLAARKAYDSLSTREKEVLELIVRGRLNKQIADDLSISIKTVEAHRAKIMDKMQARNMADLMKTALKVL